ncbi:histidine phosphatase family protein [Helicobacter didelphidarum]|uniref:Histidine phosphatase family protein n=1 Tax=Helicobacter didelphidarum TaxID=2040648 RepID=A0A3D8IM74_9HELI|nr:histidine phosphatase family protein [Helicobacter didelphidarum]RDU66377.1 histidine phosphatase family protein [Helicobacter didelphidarum]
MINTIYEGFAKSAAICPQNAKMILRHSLRDKIPPNDMGENVLLTREGEVMAEHFGKYCKFDINCIHTSIIERCVQTAKGIASGYEKSTKKNLAIHSTNILTDSYISDMSLARELFLKYSPYWIMATFIRGEKLQGMKDIHETMKILFSYIFREQNFKQDNQIFQGINNFTHNNGMEIFVTHDTFLIAIVCFCHGIVPKDEKDFFWPYMLEGAFLYRKDSKIYCIFRGEEKSIDFPF